MSNKNISTAKYMYGIDVIFSNARFTINIKVYTFQLGIIDRKSTL